MDNTNAFAAVKAITYWLSKHQLEVLNVAGPRLSKDSRIYDEVKKILSSVIHLDSASGLVPNLDLSPPLIPASVDEAVEDLISKMPLKDKIALAKQDEEELSSLHPTLGKYIREKYGLWTLNTALIESCSSLSDKESLTPDDASAIILRGRERFLLKGKGGKAMKSSTHMDTAAISDTSPVLLGGKGTGYERSVRVTFSLTNAEQNVGHDAYARLFGETRELFGLDRFPNFAEDAGRKYLLKTKKANYDFHRDFFFGDTILIKMGITEIKGASFVLNADFINDETKEVHAAASQLIVYADMAGKVKRFPEEFKMFLQNISSTKLG